jgi:hypothetical protein
VGRREAKGPGTDSSCPFDGDAIIGGFNGALREVCWFNRRLQEEEVLNVLAIQKGSFKEDAGTKQEVGTPTQPRGTDSPLGLGGRCAEVLWSRWVRPMDADVRGRHFREVGAIFCCNILLCAE